MALSLRFWIESWIVLFIRSIPVAHFGKPSPNIPIENQFGPRDRFSASRFPLDCHLARCEDTFSGRSGKPGVRLRREMRGEGSAARRAAQHFRTHPPPSTGPHGLFSRHPPVRWRQCPAQVRAAPALRREHRLDSNSRGATDVSRSAHSAMIRPRRERRARARRDASVGSDDPGLTNTPFATSAGLPPRARTSRPRATSRCVPGSCALFGDIWRHVGSRNEEKETPAPRRMWRALEPCARASGRARGGPATREISASYRRVSRAFQGPATARTPGRATPPGGSNAPLDAPPRTSGWRVFEPRTRQLDVLPLGIFFSCFTRFFVDRFAHRPPGDSPPFPTETPFADPRRVRGPLHRQGGEAHEDRLRLHRGRALVQDGRPR